MTAPWSSMSLRFLSRCAEWTGRWWGMVGRRAWPEGLLAAHKLVGMEGHATGGAQVCREGWPDGAVVAHKGAGMEGQMARGWVKRLPAGPG